MAKSKLLKLAALTFAVILTGCASNNTDTSGAGESESTSGAEETTEEVVVIDETPTTDDGSVIIDDTTIESVEDLVVMPELMTVYFDFDKANVKAEWKDLLDGHSAYLTANPDAKIILEGHCDERGTREYNLALGERRANAVASYLTLAGVTASQIEVVSFGEEKPVDMGQTQAAYSANRRVEIKYQ